MYTVGMRIIIILISFLLLSACATTPMATAPLNQKLSWPSRQAQLNQIHDWHAEGIVGIRVGQQAQSANVNLIQHGRNYHLALYGPLGADRVVLEGQPGKVTMKTSDGQITTAKSPESLLKHRLGWSLPVNNLYYWLRGLPAPHLKHTLKFDTYHHISQLQQQGWLIRYQRFAGINGQDLPTKIIMTNQTLHATIIISQWQLTPR